MKINVKVQVLLIAALLVLTSCNVSTRTTTPVASSGVKKATVKIKTNSEGLTAEQSNVKKRYENDNKIGSIKHLYVISAMSGEVILYSTVKGKVTSSGKRLTSPVKLKRGDRGEWGGDFVMPAIQDDGTYGSSIPYVFWFDVKGVYHQHYVNGGQILHIATEPMPVKSIVINLAK